MSGCKLKRAPLPGCPDVERLLLEKEKEDAEKRQEVVAVQVDISTEASFQGEVYMTREQLARIRETEDVDTLVDIVGPESFDFCSFSAQIRNLSTAED